MKWGGRNGKQPPAWQQSQEGEGAGPAQGAHCELAEGNELAIPSFEHFKRASSSREVRPAAESTRNPMPVEFEADLRQDSEDNKLCRAPSIRVKHALTDSRHDDRQDAILEDVGGRLHPLKRWMRWRT